MTIDDCDVLFSSLLALSIRAEPYRCWRNAVIACLRSQGLLDPCSYVEGWIVLPRATQIDLVEHGWICSGERIFDPSLVLVEPREQPVTYFPGLTLTREELLQHLAGRILPLVCHSEYGPDGLLHPAYQQALSQARECARALAQERHLTEDAIVLPGRTPIGQASIIEYESHPLAERARG